MAKVNGYVAKELAKNQDFERMARALSNRALGDGVGAKEMVYVACQGLTMRVRLDRAVAVGKKVGKLKMGKVAIKRGKGKVYPKFNEKMSTREYVKRYANLNGATLGKELEGFVELNDGPCGLYEGGRVDYVVVVDCGEMGE